MTILVDVPSIEQYDDIIKSVQAHKDLVPVHDDIIRILETLKQMHDDMLLGSVDCIQISRSGLELLRIENIGNKTGVSACIEINSVRKALLETPAN